MKKWQQMGIALVALMGLITMAQPVAAINVFQKCETGSSVVCKAAGNDKADSLAKKVINTMLYILGILSVVMIIAGGIRYTLSSGDASKVKASKDTVMYSVVGLIVALLAWTIVNYVIGKF